MKLRIANKILSNAIETGDEPRGTTLSRAVKAFAVGKKNHPMKYQATGLFAAFLRMDYSIAEVRLMLAGSAFERACQCSAKSNRELAT